MLFVCLWVHSRLITDTRRRFDLCGTILLGTTIYISTPLLSNLFSFYLVSFSILFRLLYFLFQVVFWSFLAV
ncbi:hypothetical protein HanRHA438_Chr06g0255511 [Helianthus annuus]|nr:hypothetical protein HanIR_Chr06g0264871 [Helianthus annuus]KAJ0910732.1 hypothetical protein HanRHA438_Chr06g0255511 [Helianthus annuus]